MPMAAAKDRYTLFIVEDDEPLDSRTDYDNFGKMVCWHSRYQLGDKHDFESPDVFLADLIRRTTNTNDVVSFVKDGNDPNIKLEYNNSTRLWDMNVFDTHFKKWHTEDTFEAPLETNLNEVRDCILEYMNIPKMLEIAEKNSCIMPLYLYDHSGITISTTPFVCRWDSSQIGWIYADKDMIENEYGSFTPETMEKARHQLEGEVETYDYCLTGQCYHQYQNCHIHTEAYRLNLHILQAGSPLCCSAHHEYRRENPSNCRFRYRRQKAEIHNIEEHMNEMEE